MLFVIFVLVFESTQDDITYIVDDVNVCAWESGVVVSSTEAFDLELETTTVDSEKNDEYLASAQANSICTAPLGASSGFYSVQLNKQFEAQ
jgi:hypothetical protein